MKQALKLSELYAPSKLTVAEVRRIRPSKAILGQNRALSAINFGIQMPPNGYHIVSSGPKGVGRTSLTLDVISQYAQTLPTPDDWCYVANFDDFNKPIALRLPAGQGLTFSKEMNHAALALKQGLQNAFSEETYKIKLAHIEQQLSAEREEYFQSLRKLIETEDVGLSRLPGGIVVCPKDKGQKISPDIFNQLPIEKRKKVLSHMKTAQEKLEKALQDPPAWKDRQQVAVEKINHDIAYQVLKQMMSKLSKAYDKYPGFLEYFHGVQSYVLDNLHMVVPGGGIPQEQVRLFWSRLAVNPFVIHQTNAGAPVIHLSRPTLPHLLGRIERVQWQGMMMTDHSFIRPGALHQANGGILVIEAQDLLDHFEVWNILKRALFERKIKMDIGDESSVLTNVSLEPFPIPLSVKVVLVGDASFYNAMNIKDAEFSQLFKLQAHFTHKMPRTLDMEKVYIRVLLDFIQKEHLLPFHPQTLKTMVEYAARFAQDKASLTTYVSKIHDIMREADFEAKTQEAPHVLPEHLEHAMVQHQYRLGGPQSDMMAAIKNGTLQIDTDGYKVGQLNSLVVHQYQAFSFGRPARVTCQIRLGAGKVIDIEREVALGGALHTKGVLILASYLAGKYGREKPLSIDASLVLEQSYNEIDGDSASAAELYCLLSAIANIPINQAIAATGAVNQLGEVQSVGAVNEKIEGFFDVCVQKGLTGKQGVIIPSTTIQSLMLEPRVRRAVENKQFHIYAVDNVSEGMEILTGLSSQEIDKAIRDNLNVYFKRSLSAK